MADSPKIFVAITPTLYQQLFTSDLDAKLHHLGDLTLQRQPRNLTSAELADHIKGYVAIVTGWGTPQFTDAVLASADQLKVIVHSAGSIKRMLPFHVFDKGIRVSSVAAAMAPAVAETTLLFIMLSLRKFHKLDQMLKTSGWDTAKSMGMGHEISGKHIGVVGAGYTGRQVIQTLQAFNTTLWVYDPYLSDEEAEKLGVKKVGLKTLLIGCPIITLQAPSTPETYRMIGAEQFSWLQDGAIFINTARSHLIDEAALLAELQTGRISAALDVFEHEPLPDDSLFRQLDNVLITPHIAAATYETRQRQGQITVDELTGFLTSGTLQYEINGSMLDVIA